MFDCSVCSHNPFVKLFGGRDNKQKGSNDGNADKEKNPGKDKSEGSLKSATSRNIKKGLFDPRNDTETRALANEWMEFLDSRASLSWSMEQIDDLLFQIIKGVDRSCDPLAEEEEMCNLWYGERSTNGVPIVLLDRNVKDIPYSVTRILVFLFADDETFNELAKLMESDDRKNTPIAMTCKNVMCVKLNHVALS